MHQVNKRFLKNLIRLFASGCKKSVTLHRQKKQRLIEAQDNKTIWIRKFYSYGYIGISVKEKDSVRLILLVK
jgi:hypothetical protein